MTVAPTRQIPDGGGLHNRRQLRVLLVGQGPPTTGGIPTFIARLIQDDWLRRRVWLQYLNTTPKRIAKRPGRLHISILGLGVGDMWRVFRLSSNADVAHLVLAAAPALPLLRALMLSIAAKLSGARVVMHSHTGRLPAYVGKRVFRTLLRLLLLVADSFIVVSRAAEAAVSGMSEKVIRIENGIHVDEIPIGPKALERPTLLFVGTVCERKGLIDLRDALVAIAGDGTPLQKILRVIIVGDAAQEGPGVYERVKDAYAQAGLDVEFLGPIERSKVVVLLSRSNIFCLPSYWEGFPLSLLEAMAAENAVVATKVGDMPAILDNGSAGVLIDPHDVGSLAEAIRRLAIDPVERVHLGRAARARVRDEYGYDKTVLSLYEIYERVTGFGR